MSHISSDTHLSSHPRLIMGLILVTLAAFIACAWKLTPAAQYLSPPIIAQLFQDIRNSEWAVPAVIGMYILGSMVFFPLTILILATSLVFPPIEASCIALVGSVSSACMGYAIGRFSGLNPRQFMAGRGGNIINKYTKHAGVLGVAILRMVPLLPLGVVDVGLGMAQIPFSTYIVATLIGLFPGILALSFLGSSLGGLWHSHNLHALVYVALGILAWLGIAAISHFAVCFWQNKRGVATA